MKFAGSIATALATVGRWLRHPLIWLLLQMLVVFVAHDQAGRLEPIKNPDTRSYFVAADAETVTEAMSHYRTYGYPLFLRMLGWAGLERDHLPTVQILIYFVAAFVFWAAAVAFSAAPWLAFAAASPLLYAPVLDLAPVIQPDFLSAAGILAATSLTLLLTVRGGSPVVWTLLGLSVFFSYQVRPASVFLVVWIPFVAWLCSTFRTGEPRRALAWGLKVLLLTALPYLAFAGFRWATVGHFGLVAFGGLNSSAVAACFIDRDLVRDLPTEQQRLAQRILKARKRRNWKPMVLGSETEQYFEQYNENLWRIANTIAWDERRTETREAIAAASDPSPAGVDRIVVNERLTRLSRSVFRRRPLHYLQWIRDAFVYGVKQLSDYHWIRWPWVLLILSLAIGWLSGPIGVDPGDRHRSSFLLMLAFVAVSYFLLYPRLISLVSFPFQRYLLSTILFLPSILTAILFEIWRRVLGCVIHDPASRLWKASVGSERTER
jgi:hypothetical protein